MMHCIGKFGSSLQSAKAQALTNRTKDSANDAILVLTIISAALTTLAIIVTIHIGVVTYNHRYDANAKGADGFVLTFQSNRNTGVSTIVASAGTIRYGFFQKSGKCPTKYQISYKKSSSSSYKNLRNVTVYKNNDPEGDYKLISSRYSGSYDIKVNRKSQKNTTSKFEVDWAVS